MLERVTLQPLWFKSDRSAGKWQRAMSSLCSSAGNALPAQPGARKRDPPGFAVLRFNSLGGNQAENEPERASRETWWTSTPESGFVFHQFLPVL